MLALAACSSAPDESAESSNAALVSNSRTFLVPNDEGARTLCRDQVNASYCDAASADAARARCRATLAAAGASGDLREETYAEACYGDGPVYPDSASCRAPRPRNCSFYSACVERQTPCGEAGYALGYGEKYCTAFENATGFTATGAAWRDSVMHCLQVALVPYSQPASAASCDEITNAAFDSHPRCYTLPEHSICFLPPSDIATVLRTIGGKELLTARSRAQIVKTIETCILQIGGWLFSSATSVDRAALEEQHALWRDLSRRYAD